MRLPPWFQALVLSLMLFAGAIVPGAAAHAAEADAKPPAVHHSFNNPSANGHLIPLDAIVQITCTNTGGHHDSGTGSVYQPGRVLTANHVVIDAETPTSCKVNDKPATIVWGDDGLDAAILETDTSAYPMIPVSCSGVKAGEVYLAIGYSLGEDFAIDKLYAVGTTTDITISEHGVKHHQSGMAEMEGYLFEGQSGGPVLDLNGRMVGINDAANPYAPQSLIRLLSDTPLCPQMATLPPLKLPKLVLKPLPRP